MGRVVAGVLRAALVLAGPGWVSDGLAAPGALDPSFGTGGSIVTTFGWGGDDSAARVIVRQRDGKLVAGGTGWDGEYGFALARYDRHGVLDPTFGEDGRVVTYWGHLDYHGRTITGLVEHDDGTLVAAGTLDTGGGLEIGVVRYTPEGRLDPTFGVDGRVRTILSGYDLAEDVALQPDGKIVVAGSTGYAMLLARYDRDGALDPTFGGVGWVSHDFGTYAAGRAVLVQPDGKIVIAGDTFGVEGDRLALARYLGDGTLDPTFGDGGTVLAATPSEYAEVTAMIRQPDGRLVVSGFVDSAGDDFLLARFDVDGAPDPTFGDAGVVVTAVSSSYDRAFDVTALADGRLVVVGWSYTSTSQVALTRLLADGSLDPTFGGGTVVVEFPGAFDEAYDVLADDDGTVVVAGSTMESGSPNPSFALARVATDGTLDPTFGHGGCVTTSLASSDDRPTALALRSDGRIVSGGSSWTGSEGGFALLRHDADGKLDPTFGDGGKVISAFGGAIAGITTQDEVNVIAAGTVHENGRSRFALARYLDDGSLDPTFGTGGLAATDLGANTADARALLRQRDGKLVIVGSSYDGVNTCALTRYDHHGILDPTFGTGGIARANAGYPSAIVEQSDGKLVVVGTASSSFGSPYLAIARFTPDGHLDTTFGSTGTLFLGTSLDIAHAFTSVVDRLDGSVVGIGANSLIAFLTNGRTDSTFGSSGIVVAPIGHGAGLREPGGAIVGAGYVNAFPYDGYTTSIALARYRPNGTLDPTFGDAGVVRTPLGGSAEIVAVARQDDTKIVALARSDADFALLRYFSQHCGNGVVDAGETCDDGNVAAGDCCSPTCTLEPSGTPCRDAAGRCDAPETCDGASPVCPAAVVDPCITRCPAEPQECRMAARSRVTRKLPLEPRQRRLGWRWTRGASTTLAELGDPTAGTEYALCFYGGGNPALVGEIVVADRARWRAVAGKGWLYSDPAATLGVTKIVLRASDRDRAKIVVAGKGAALPATPVPAGSPLTVQLVNAADGLCWGATHAAR